MHRQVLGFWKAESLVAASTLLALYPVAASPRLVSLAFNSQLQSPQQMGADELRQKLVAAAGKHIVLDERATPDKLSDAQESRLPKQGHGAVRP